MTENKAQVTEDKGEKEKSANLKTRFGLQHDDDISLEGSLHIVLDCIETLSHTVKELEDEIKTLKGQDSNE